MNHDRAARRADIAWATLAYARVITVAADAAAGLGAGHALRAVAGAAGEFDKQEPARAPRADLGADDPGVAVGQSGPASGRRYVGVVCDAGRLCVEVAAGCLLQPAVGDLVLVCLGGRGDYLLSILESGCAAPRELRVAGDAALVAEGGHLTLSGECGMALDAGPSFSVDAGVAQLRFGQAHLACASLEASGASARSVWQETSVVAGRSFTAAASAEVHLGECLREVAGHDEARVGSLRVQVADDWTVQAGDATLVAERRVTVDADGQIQIG